MKNHMKLVSRSIILAALFILFFSLPPTFRILGGPRKLASMASAIGIPANGRQQLRTQLERSTKAYETHVFWPLCNLKTIASWLPFLAAKGLGISCEVPGLARKVAKAGPEKRKAPRLLQPARKPREQTPHPHLD